MFGQVRVARNVYQNVPEPTLSAEIINQLAQLPTSPNDINSTEWGYLASQNQALDTAQTPTWAGANLGNVTITGNTVSTSSGGLTVSSSTGVVEITQDPTTNLGIATRQYVDNYVNNYSHAKNARLITVGALSAYTQSGTGVGATLTADANSTLFVDGLEVVVSDRILVNDDGSTSSTHNGVYSVTQIGDVSNPWILTRATDYDENSEIISGSRVYVTEGNTKADLGFLLTTDPVDIDVGALNYIQISGGSQTASNIGAGDGWFKQISGSDFEFKTLITSGSVLGTTNNTNDLTLTFTQTNITATGALDGGSITSNFGNIDIGVSDITCNQFTIAKNIIYTGSANIVIANEDVNTTGHEAIIISDTLESGYTLPSGSRICMIANTSAVGGIPAYSATNAFHTCIGYNPPGSISGSFSGDEITTMGVNCMRLATSGDCSVVIGTNPANNVTSLDTSVIIGARALQDSTGANNSQCVAIGMYSYNLGNAANNTTVGYRAGDQITTGEQNTCLGSLSDCSATVDNSIALGYQTVVTTSNTCTIGNSSLITIQNSGNGVCDLGGASNRFKTLYAGDLNSNGSVTGTKFLHTGSDGLLVGNIDVDMSSNTESIVISPNLETGFTVDALDEIILLATTDEVGGLPSYDSTVGSMSVIIGHNPPGSATGSTNNNKNMIAIGADLMPNENGVAAENILIGYELMLATTSNNTWNVLLGTKIMELGTNSAGNCIGIGRQTLNRCEGDYNIGLGYQTLALTNTGTSNVGIGQSAGLYNSTGSNNVYVGRDAGCGSGSGTISNTVAIGYGANTTASNTMVFGNNSMTALYNEGNGTCALGGASNRFGTVYGTALNVSGDITVGGTVDSRNINADGNILDNLNTTLGLGSLTTAEVTQLQNINSYTISGTIWGRVAAMQAVDTTDSVTFAQVTVDNIVANANLLTTTSGDLTISSTGGDILLTQTGSASLSLVSKAYVDNIAVGIRKNYTVRVKTAAALDTYSQSGTKATGQLDADGNGALTIDGVTMVVNDRVLVCDNGSTSSLHNGVYEVTNIGSAGTPWQMVRADPENENVELPPGTHFFISEGTTYADTGFIITSNTVDIDVSAINFTQFSAAGTVTASNVGSGSGWFKTKNGSDLEFKSVITANSILGIASNTNDLTFTITQGNITGTGALNSGSITSGFGNIDIGSSTITAGLGAIDILTMDVNILIGEIGDTPRTMSTATGNIFMGKDAGSNRHADGTANICIGGAAGGEMADTTTLCTFIGPSAGFNYEGGEGAIGIGLGALGGWSPTNKTTGNNCIAIGFNALTSLESGGNNCYIASYPSFACNQKTGSDNVVIGYRTAEFLTDSDNVLIGSDNARTAVAADNCIIIGSGADVGSASAQNAIAIGSGVSADTNEIVIGTNAATIMKTEGDGVCDLGGSSNKYKNLYTVSSIHTGYSQAAVFSATTTNIEIYDSGDTATKIVSGGTNNIYMGNGAGGDMATGNSNIAIGFSAASGISNNVASSISIGTYAGRYMSNNQDGFIAMGSYACGGRTGGGVTGTNNYCIGRNAGDNLSSGSNNYVVVSNSAQSDLATGSRNTLFGVATANNVNSDDNTIIGYVAGSTLSSGIRSVIVGSNADVALLGDDNAIAIGYTAVAGDGGIAIGASITGGANEIVIGSGTNTIMRTAGDGVCDLGGSSNKYKDLYCVNSIATGYARGAVWSSSSNNVELYNSGQTTSKITSGGTANIIIGNNAGSDKSGGSNVFIGPQSGSSTGLTTASAICIGNNAGRYVNNNQSGFLAIGAYANGGRSSGGSSGAENSCVGRNAGDNLTSGSNNAIYAHSNVQTSLSTGWNNTTLGFKAGVNINSDSNTLIGYAAGDILTTGNNCTALGKNADFNASSNVNSVVIGSDTSAATSCVVIGASSTSTADNVIAIGLNVDSTTANEILIGNSSHTLMRTDGDGDCDIGNDTNPYGQVYATGVNFTNPTIHSSGSSLRTSNNGLIIVNGGGGGSDIELATADEVTGRCIRIMNTNANGATIEVSTQSSVLIEEGGGTSTTLNIGKADGAVFIFNGLNWQVLSMQGI